jgi:hypothetical protein
MSAELQTYAVVAVVAIAAAYVLWTVVAQFRARGKACGGSCSGCGASEKSLGEPKGFVDVKTLSSHQKS